MCSTMWSACLSVRLSVCVRAGVRVSVPHLPGGYQQQGLHDRQNGADVEVRGHLLGREKQQTTGILVTGG